MAAEDEDEWPPPGARYRAALWRGEAHLARREWYRASVAFADAAPLAPAADRELVRGLLHLAAAGYRREDGDGARAQRELAHARRRLEPYLPAHDELAVAALLRGVEKAINPPPGGE